MNIIYVSNTCSPQKYTQYVERKKVRVSQQSQKYNLLLAEGLADNGAQVSVVSSRPINRNVEKRLWMKAEQEQVNGLNFDYVAFINYPFLRNLCVFVGTFGRILFSRKKKSESVVICDALNISAAMGALAAAFLRRFPTMGIVTDVPVHLSYSRKVSLAQKLNLAIMRRFKSYLLLTKQMSEVVNPKERPYIVLEGHADQKMAAIENTLEGKAKQKIVLYAGSLMKIYGIGQLVEGFVAANIPNTELQIYGSGDYEQKLKALAEQHENVKYLGVAANDDIVKAEIAATLLVNPRPSHEDYTKYSFPSKNMEYMASGTPVLTTRLPGMPEDHKPYVYFIEQEDAEGIKAALQQIFSQDEQTLHAFGAKAKDFILEEKNNRAQAAKVIAFIKKSFQIR